MNSISLLPVFRGVLRDLLLPWRDLDFGGGLASGLPNSNFSSKTDPLPDLGPTAPAPAALCGRLKMPAGGGGTAPAPATSKGGKLLYCLLGTVPVPLGLSLFSGGTWGEILMRVSSSATGAAPAGTMAEGSGIISVSILREGGPWSPIRRSRVAAPKYKCKNCLIRTNIED